MTIASGIILPGTELAEIYRRYQIKELSLSGSAVRREMRPDSDLDLLVELMPDVSPHQWPLYPGTGRADETGEGPGEGTTMNCPFPAGSGRREILGAVEIHLLPAAACFQPDLVLISAGFDSRARDPLGRFTLTDEDFACLTRAVMGIADRHAGGRVISMLEGGYNLEGLGSAAAAHAGALLDG